MKPSSVEKCKHTVLLTVLPRTSSVLYWYQSKQEIKFPSSRRQGPLSPAEMYHSLVTIVRMLNLCEMSGKWIFSQVPLPLLFPNCYWVAVFQN